MYDTCGGGDSSEQSRGIAGSEHLTATLPLQNLQGWNVQPRSADICEVRNGSQRGPLKRDENARGGEFIISASFPKKMACIIFTVLPSLLGNAYSMGLLSCALFVSICD